MKKSDKIALVLANIFLWVSLTFITLSGYAAYKDCEASEGVLVLGVGRFVCVDIGRVK